MSVDRVRPGAIAVVRAIIQDNPLQVEEALAQIGENPGDFMLRFSEGAHFHGPVPDTPTGHPILVRHPDILCLAVYYNSLRVYNHFKQQINHPRRPVGDGPAYEVTPPTVNFAMVSPRLNLDLIRELLERNEEPWKNTLPVALETGNREVVDLVYRTLKSRQDNDQDFLQTQMSGSSALARAIRSRSPDVVNWVLSVEKEANNVEIPTLWGKKRKTALLVACRHPNYEILKLIIGHEGLQEMIDIEAKGEVMGKQRETSLIAFMRRVDYMDATNEALVDLIFSIQWSQNNLINSCDAGKKTALHWAVERSLLLCIERLCQEESLVVGAKDVISRSPLQIAVENCNFAIVEKILNLFPDDKRLSDMLRSDKNALGRSPLHVAVKEDWVEGVELLLERDPGLASIQDYSGFVPVMLAGIYSCLKVLRWFATHRNPDIVKTIAEPCSLTNWTILHYAAYAGNADVLKMLLEVDYLRDSPRLWESLELKDKDGGTPLVLAARVCNVKCLQVLIAFGASPENGRNLMGKPGKSLHIARILDMAQNGLNMVHDIYNADTLKEAARKFRVNYPEIS